MDRSPGFGSARQDFTRCSHSLSLRLRLRPRLAMPDNSQAHYAKGTRSRVVPAPAVCGRMVSGSVSLPSRGSFHLSLTVLVHYRSAGSIQPWGVGPPDSDGVSRVPSYLGFPRPPASCAHGAVTRYGRPFQTAALHALGRDGVPQPRRMNPPVWAPPRSLAATCGITVCLLLLRVLRCFTSPGLASRRYRFTPGWRPSTGRRIAPFGNPRIKGRMRLPVAYRSLPRPSSPPAAKASAIRPCSLAALSRPPRRGRPPAGSWAAGPGE